MHRSVIPVLTGIVALSLVVSGCGSSSSAQNSNSGELNSSANTNANPGNIDLKNAKGTIIWAANPITRTGVRVALVKKFNEEHPNIKVILQTQPTNSNTNRASLTSTIGGGSAQPDVYMGDVTWPAQFGQNDLALALNKYLPSSFFDRFATGLVKGATYKGNVYAAPFFVDSAFIYYRKDILQQAGLPVPTSWEQLESEAAQLVKSGTSKYGFVWEGGSYEGGTCNFMEYLADAGGQVLNSQGQDALNSAAAKKALTFMTSLVSSGASPKAVSTMHENDAMNAFDSGDAVFLRNWSYAWGNSQSPGGSKVVGKVGIVPLPTFGGPNGYATVGGWNLMVNPHTQNLAASLAFVDWITGPEAQKILAEQFKMIPTNASVQNDPDAQKATPLIGDVTKDQWVSRPSQVPNYPQISEAIYQNMNQALSGGVTPSQAIEQADQQIKSSLGNSGL